MLTNCPRSRGRAGMTLIEILVVIAIIAILAGLLLAGVMGAFSKGYEAQNRSDMLNLAQALQSFKAKYGFYPPDQLKLHAKYGDYNTNTQLDAQSLMYLNRMFPNAVAAWQANPNSTIAWAGTYSDGHTAYPIPGGAGGGFVLAQDQCLVFFLGGPPIAPVAGGAIPPADVNQVGVAKLLGGFSVNTTDPIWLGPYSAARKQLDRVNFFKFDAGRLFYREAGSPFPSYRDAWPADGTSRLPSPYVYFSAGNATNGYTTTNLTTGAAPAFSMTAHVKGAAMVFPLNPYVQNANTSPPTFWNSDSFQLISAGPDGVFGPGGNWPPASGFGTDDFSNFSGSQLGAGVTN